MAAWRVSAEFLRLAWMLAAETGSGALHSSRVSFSLRSLAASWVSRSRRQKCLQAGLLSLLADCWWVLARASVAAVRLAMACVEWRGCHAGQSSRLASL